MLISGFDLARSPCTQICVFVQLICRHFQDLDHQNQTCVVHNFPWPRSLVTSCLFLVDPLSYILQHYLLKIIQGGFYLTVWNSLNVSLRTIRILPLELELPRDPGIGPTRSHGWRSSKGPRSKLHPVLTVLLLPILIFLISSFMSAISF